MTTLFTRRHVLMTLLASTTLAATVRAPRAGDWDSDAPFSFDWLKATMQARASAPDQPPEPLSPFLGALTYDDYRNIYFRPAAARWADGQAPFQLQPFHPGWLFPEPVQLFELTGNSVQPLTFSTDDFEYRNAVADKLPDTPTLPGVAGLKINTPFNTADKFDELITFLGASYFRALGSGNSYGLSARGLAVDTWQAGPEEFPRFSAFWVQRPQPGDAAITVYAAMDSASLTGAYRFVITPGADTVMDVEVQLYFRNGVDHLGVVPLTSMFYFAEHSARRFDDFRPQVHDSDMLQMVRGSGDVMVRPLNNPPRVSNSFFADNDITNFGLLQRDRSYEAYQDAGAQYHRRPSVMIDRLGNWGAGQIRLIEIPADLEIEDNIVLLWVPDVAPVASETRTYRYRMHWGALPPDGTGPLAYVHATRTGIGGPSGVPLDNPNLRKFVIDFEGGDLGAMAPETPVVPVVTTSHGVISNAICHKIEDTESRWRLFFDLDTEGADLVELSAHVAGEDRKLTEVWLFQWIVEPA